jgi:hypothetical protein
MITRLEDLTPEQRAKLRELELVATEWEDHPEGPYFHDDGTPFKGGPNDFTARAPAHHPRRCHSPSQMRDGRRCQKWSEPGRNHCKWHGGKTPLILVARMPAPYRKHLMPSLQQVLDEFLESKPYQEALDLRDEIALARTLLSRDLEIWTQLQLLQHKQLKGENLNGDAKQPPITTDHIAMASSAITDRLDQVAELCKKASEIERGLQDGVSVKALGFFVAQISAVIAAKLGPGNEEMVKQLSEELREKVKLPANPELDPRVEIRVDFEDEAA